MSNKKKTRRNWKDAKRLNNAEHEMLKYERAIRPRRVTQVKLSRVPRSMNRRKGKLSRLEYQEYLKSSHWQRFKTLYEMSSNTEDKCIICGSFEYELHHRTYERLGAEFFTDVIPLCRRHHELAHERVKTGTLLWDAHLS